MNSYFKFPEPFTDGITNEVKIHVHWRDRLQVLIGGEIVVRSVILVEHAPGRIHASTTVAFLKVPRWINRLLRIGARNSQGEC